MLAAVRRKAIERGTDGSGLLGRSLWAADVACGAMEVAQGGGSSSAVKETEDVAGWFYQLGKLAGPKVRKGRWLWKSLTGSREEVAEAERQMGADLAAEIRRQVPLETDADVNRLVATVGRRVARAVADKTLRFQVEVLAGGEPNAFALPGGFVFVTRSLVELCERRQEELAFVVAHEMAHVIRGHALDRVLSDSATAAAARAMPARGALGAWVRQVGFRYLSAAYSRDRELGADALGARLAEAAGYGRDGAVRLLERLERMRREGLADALGLGDYFATHPPTAERIREVRKAPPV